VSQYGLIYRLEFLNNEGFTIRTNIYPTDVLIPDADTPTVIDLMGGDQPVIIQTSNNEEDKLAPIRSKSARIKFRSDRLSGLDSATFSQGGDDLWRVDIYLQDTPELIFTGFLIMADNQQPFQPDPQYVTLTATDHLGALKEIELVDLEDNFPVGKYRVAELIAMCLRKTGLSLDIFVINNLRAGGGRNTYPAVFDAAADTVTFSTNDTTMFYVGQRVVISGTTSNNYSTTVSAKTSTTITLAASVTNETAAAAVFLDYVSQFHWYDVVYLDADTFEKTIGTCENCSEVLKKILGEDCFITQYKGNWWIYRVDEMEGNPIYVAEFDANGLYISTAAGAQYNMSIGRVEDLKFANADTLLRFIRPHDFIRETFNYNTPLETPCNINFSQGALNTTVSATEKWYDIDCWTMRRGLPGAYNVPITITAFIVREFNQNSYEIERYVRITPQTGHAGFSSTDDEYIESEAIPVNISDKFEASIQWKIDADIGSSSAQLRLFRLVLIGDDGSAWILGEATVGDGIPVWYDTASWTANTGKGATGIVFGDQDETDWQTIEWIAPPVPVAGSIYIWANQVYNNAAVPASTIIFYSNLRFDYIPLINGTYTPVSGQSSRVDRTEDGYMANRDNEVFISDSPAPLFKGSMFISPVSAYLLFPHWFAASVWGNSYPTDTTYLHPYGYIQAFSVWNQFKGYNDAINGRGIGINIFSGSIRGLTDDWPDLIHKYTLTDADTQTNNRYFILISLTQDWKSCIWTGVLVEVYNTAIGKTYSDPFEFKYISE